MIDQRLFDWYGIDTTKDLNIKRICGRPFNTVLIDKNGSCFACECTAWLPKSIGNLHRDNLSNILQGKVVQELKLSVSDGSYRYCNDKLCPYIITDHIQNTEYEQHQTLKYIRLAIDDSCNLSCPSCRKQKIFLHRGKQFYLRLSLVEKIIEYLEKNSNREFNIHIGSDGDPFASLVYRNFMRKTESLNNLSYSILTNGLLIKKNFFKFKHIINNLTTIGFSVDGATKSTYEKLRKGGKFELMLDNLKWICDIKRNFQVELHCVVQKDNFKEIPQYIEMAKDIGVDRVWLNKITDWGVLDNFQDKAIWKKNHKDYKEFMQIVKQLRSRDDHKSYFINTDSLT